MIVPLVFASFAFIARMVEQSLTEVNSGVIEAARSLGFSYFRSMILIVFPQAIKNSMASIGNEFVINIKDTSVLNVIGCAEMYWVLNKSAAINARYMEQMITGALVYLVLTYSITKLLHFIEKKLDAPVAELKGSN